MLKKFHIGIILLLSMFLMFHQTYAHTITFTKTETKACCKTKTVNKVCCKKTTACESKNCCTVSVLTATAIIEKVTFNVPLLLSFYKKQKTTHSLPFFSSPNFSVWQPPKIV